jgi:quaternary ammonium compound-resistance protein SugE
MSWFLLLAAGLLEVVWAFTMKRSDGFSSLGPSVITIAAMIASFLLLAQAMKLLPLGTAYAVWTGIGALGAFLVGVLVLGEQASAIRIASVVLILVGVVGLKVG